MKTNILNIAGVEVLSKQNLKAIKGQGLEAVGPVDLSLCGCSCSGSVTGPKYCVYYIACPQVYTCDQSAI